jgi:hypothetical protein
MESVSHLLDFLRARPESEVERAAQQARKQEIIEKLSRAIISRRLESPATLFLELNRPIGFLMSQAAFFARPFLSFFLPPEDVSAAAEVLADPDALEQLLQRLSETDQQVTG